MIEASNHRIRLEGEKQAIGTWRALAEKYGINQAYVYNFVVHGTMPPSKVARRLGIVSKALETTRQRRNTLNTIAQSWGYKSWSTYETETIRTYCPLDTDNKGE